MRKKALIFNKVFLIIYFLFVGFVFAEEKGGLDLPELIILGEDLSRVDLLGKGLTLSDRPAVAKFHFLDEIVIDKSSKSFLRFAQPSRARRKNELSLFGGNFDSLGGSIFYATESQKNTWLSLFLNGSKGDDEFENRSYSNGDIQAEFGVIPNRGTSLRFGGEFSGKRYHSPFFDDGEFELIERVIAFSAGRTISDIMSLELQLEGQKGKFSTDVDRFKDVDQTLGRSNILSLRGGVLREVLEDESEEKKYNVRYIEFKNRLLITKCLNLTLGIRRDHDTRLDEDFITGLGNMQFRIIGDILGYVGYAPRLYSPLFRETYYDNDYLGVNYSLLPEKKKFFLEEGIILATDGGLRSQLGFFQYKTEDFIVINDTTSLGEPINIDEVDFLGVKFNSRLKITKNLFKEIDYIFQEESNEDSIRVPYHPRHSLFVRLKYERRFWGGDVSFTTRSKRYYNVDGGSLPSYGIWGIRFVIHPFDGYNLFIKIDNLREKEYSLRYGYPYKGRRYQAGLSVKF